MKNVLGKLQKIFNCFNFYSKLICPETFGNPTKRRAVLTISVFSSWATAKWPWSPPCYELETLDACWLSRVSLVCSQRGCLVPMAQRLRQPPEGMIRLWQKFCWAARAVTFEARRLLVRDRHPMELSLDLLRSSTIASSYLRSPEQYSRFWRLSSVCQPKLELLGSPALGDSCL